jgi:hypothetical protein
VEGPNLLTLERTPGPVAEVGGCSDSSLGSRASPAGRSRMASQTFGPNGSSPCSDGT